MSDIRTFVEEHIHESVLDQLKADKRVDDVDDGRPYGDPVSISTAKGYCIGGRDGEHDVNTCEHSVNEYNINRLRSRFNAEVTPCDCERCK